MTRRRERVIVVIADHRCPDEEGRGELKINTKYLSALSLILKHVCFSLLLAGNSGEMTVRIMIGNKC